MKRFCAVIAGLVFFVSGTLKLIDPVGSGLVVDGYFSFLHLGFLSGLSGILGPVLSLAEAILGIALLTGAYKRLTAKVAIVLTGFFTILTFILLIANPKMDCGCFGQAIHLTHAQTFIKNIVLCFLVAYSCLPIPAPGCSSVRAKKVFVPLGALATAIAVYSIFFLPLWDFTAFAPGDRIYDASSPFPPIKNQEPGFVYAKDGLEQEFSLDALPDSTWTFVRQSQSEPLAVLPSNIVPVSSPDGACADSVLLEGRIIAVSVNAPESISDSRWRAVSGFVSSISEAGITPVLLVSSAPEEFESCLENLSTEDRVRLLMVTYFSDHKVLMTLNRSNSGAVLLDSGLIVDKWSRYSLPSVEELSLIATAHPGPQFIKASVPGRLLLMVFMALIVLISLFTHKRES